MTDPTPSLPPAGWLPDANVPGQNRWWDGTQWTDRVTPMASPATVAPAGPEPSDTVYSTAENPTGPARDLPTPKNTPATVGLVLALISLLANPFLIVGVVALVFGIVGLTKASTMSAQGFAPTGRMLAIWAIVIAGVGSFLTVVFKSLLF